MKFENVSKNAFKKWLLNGTIGSIILMMVVIASYLLILANANEDWTWLLQLVITLPLGLILVYIIVNTYFLRSIRYRNLTYKLDFNRIEKTSGVIFLKHEVVPFVRMQHVEILRTVTDRIFNMSTIIIHTAGSNIMIPCIQVKQAEELLHEIRESLDKLKVGDANAD